MNHRILMLTAGMLMWCSSFAQDDYSLFFTGDRLRYDFLLAGNSSNTSLFPGEISMEPSWAGSQVNLIDTMNYGTYRYRVFDLSTGKLLFSKGFCTLFQEWQTTLEAKTTDRAFFQSLFFPFPRNEVRLTLEYRDWQGIFRPLHEAVIDPANYFINSEKPLACEVIHVVQHGEPADHTDLVFLSEGYTGEEKDKFVRDVGRMSGYLLSVSPFAENSERFNVTAVWAPSEESGTDIPGERLYRNTRLNSTFYTFNLDRYLTTSDLKSIYDLVSGVPWDHAIVLVNTDRYGGGGFYNLLCVCSAGHELSGKVMVHEFGHAFAGLGDEYYNSSVAYENFYNPEVEPWEPNLTTLVDFGSKWKAMLRDSIPVPTPRTPRYSGQTGVFEGGGYMTEGIYSPMQDCRMKSNQTDEFCPVCKEAIHKAIKWNTGN